MVSIDLNRFRAVQNAVGSKHIKDVKLTETRQRFIDRFESSYNYEYEVTRNDKEQQFIIAPSHSDRSVCTIFARVGEELNMGDIIYWHELHWLITEIDFSDSTSRSGKMERCNRTICWQNPDTKEIIERWCIAEKPYTSNIDEGKEVNTSNREFKIQIPFDEETALVDIDKRFLLETIGGRPKAYKCTCVDTVTNKYQDIQGGFLIWNLTQDEYNDKVDNPDLMIADYKEPIDPVVGDVEVTYAGEPIIRIGGSAKTFKANAENVTWDAVMLPEIEQYITIQRIGNNVKLKAARENSIVGTTIQLIAKSENSQSTINVKILGGV